MLRQDFGGLHRWRTALELVSMVAMIVASSVLVWAVVISLSSPTPPPRRLPSRSPFPKPLPAAPVSLEGAPVLGDPRARIGVIQYSDFECPFSARFHQDTSATIVRAYVDTGKVLFAFRHLPLEQKHPAALSAAQAAECGARQGKFWSMYDQLFAAPRTLNVDSILAKAERTGLDADIFRRCMRGEALDRVRRDIDEARRLSITGTPSFLFGTVESGNRLRIVRHESGAIPAHIFARMLDELLDPGTSTGR